jgi:hypothetical protein
MRLVFAACAATAALLLAGAYRLAAPVSADTPSTPRTGTWTIQSGAGNDVQLTLMVRGADGSDTESDSVPYLPASFDGISLGRIKTLDGPATFRIVRDAGAFDCRGSFAGGQGGGVFTYAPSAAFAAALASRGLGGISDDDQFALAMSGFALATLDQLRATGTAGLTGHELVALSQHGVDGEYVRAMAAQSVRPATADEWVRLRDHGVEPEFVAALSRDGLHPDPDELVELADHGVDAAFASGVEKFGYHPSVDDLVRLCDHGVTLAFIADMRAHGYAPTIDDLIRLRDSGF